MSSVQRMVNDKVDAESAQVLILYGERAKEIKGADSFYPRLRGTIRGFEFHQVIEKARKVAEVSHKGAFYLY